ncbi:MAG: YbbR-like domain-containing protein [Bryobacterales bacterium]|nr:YbbR-like domain-containing protein [Bryobacterales bacterium]MBV9399154.1 YbbR-like domain-containing protein [Bryobacterales bacterium]
MSRTGGLVRKLTPNLGWKVASLLIAMLLWYAVEGAPESVTIHTVPVLYRNLASGLILSSDTPETVRAELRGTSVKLTLASLAQVSAALDLSDVRGPGERTFNLSRENFSLPGGISFLHVIPSQVRLVVDRIAYRDVPVNVRIEGTPPAGYTLVRREITPDKLRISGPERRVTRVEFAETDPIDVSSMTETSEVRVNAFIPDQRVQFDSQSAVIIKLTFERIPTR